MKNRLALIGFGTVGQGLIEILMDKSHFLKEKYNFEWEVVAISDMLKGSIYHPDGLDMQRVMNIVQAGKPLEEYEQSGLQKGWDAITTIESCNADMMCELSYTDIKTGQPATDHCRAALAKGMHVITSNKGPTALFYNELEELAKSNNAQFMIEGTVMSGTPVLNLARNTLAGNQITAVKGILNGTTNFILSNMEKGRAYDEVLKEAQELGYAEADPTADVEGFDALAKVAILANVIMGENLKPEDIPVKGISGLTLEDIDTARNAGKRWKLIGEIKQQDNGVTASVAPMMIDLSHPLAGVMGATNAVTFTTDLMGDVTVNGAGAGRIETGFSILVDILEIHNQR